MTRQDFWKKWLLYGLLLLFVALLQRQVFGRIRLLGVMPVLMPAAVIALASLEGAVGGGAFGIAAGVLATSLDGSRAWAVLLLCLCGVASGVIIRHVVSRSFPGYLLCCLGAMALREAGLVLTKWWQGVAGPLVLLRVAAPELLYTMLVSPLIYVMFRFLYYRWGAGYYE